MPVLLTAGEYTRATVHASLVAVTAGLVPAVSTVTAGIAFAATQALLGPDGASR